MATYYIDPTAGSGGDGSFASPFDSWADVMTSVVAIGDIVLQKEGTTAIETVTVRLLTYTEANPLRLGTYDAATGEQLFTTTRRAIIAPSSGRGINLGTRPWVFVDSLDCRGAGTSAAEGINGQAASATTAHKITIRRCRMSSTGFYGLQLTGDGDTVEDCEIAGYTDGALLLCANLTFRRNLVQSASINPATYDGISLTGTHNFGTTVIEDNEILDFVGSKKQGIYCAGAGTGSVTVRRNRVVGFNTSILCLQPAAVLEANRLSGALERGVTLDAADIVARANIVTDTDRMISIADRSGCVVDNNTGVDVDEGIVWNTGTNTGTMRNNSISRRAGSVLPLMTKITTVTLTRSNNRYFAPDGGAQFLNDGTSHDTFAAYNAIASESGSSAGDPLLSPAYRPLPGSPLIGAGTYIAD